MAEWSIAAVLKTVDLKGSGGSNPSLSVVFSTQLIEKTVSCVFCIHLPQKARFRKYLIISVSINPFYNISVNIVNFISANRRCRHYFGVFAGYLSYFDDFLF